MGCGTDEAPLFTLDTTNVASLKTVEAVATIAEYGSILPVVGTPLAIIAGVIRAGQGNFTEAGSNFLAAVPFGSITRLSRIGKAANVADEAIERARELGRAGELAAGITGPKRAIQVGGRKLFPDQVTRSALTEVKNVGKLSYTRQLREYSNYAQGSSPKLDFILVTRPGTKLSGPLRKAIDQGLIIHRPILPF